MRKASLTESVSVGVIEKVLRFLNDAKTPEDIAGKEPQAGPVYDDPSAGNGDGYDIGIGVAKRILGTRDRLGKFTQIEQLRGIRGFGRDKFADLVYSVSADAPKPGKNSRDFWIDKANDEIAFTPPGISDRLELHVRRNRKITAAYAKLFAEHHHIFPWLGAAAFASNEVGITIATLRSNWKAETNRNVAKALFDAADKLGDGNGDVYSDIYWQCLAYRDGGIEQMRELNTTKDGKGNPMLSADMRKAWELIDAGRQKKDPNKIWDGNKLLFLHEQKDILQPRVFDTIPAAIGKRIAEFTVPLFPGATKFSTAVPGGNLANFDDRWTKWIEPKLWKEWRKYNEDNSDWKADKNPLRAAMQRMIEGGKEKKQN